MAALKLEVFTTADSVQDNIVVTDLDASEEARLTAYEQGYNAGWEDAAAAQADEQSRLRADLAHNLQALGFTFHEARVHVLKALQPLLADIIGQILPAVSRISLGPVVLEALIPLAEGLAETPVTIVLHPTSRLAVESLLEQATDLPITIREEATLGESQVYLKLGDAETCVDLGRASAAIGQAVQDFFDLAAKEKTDA